MKAQCASEQTYFENMASNDIYVGIHNMVCLHSFCLVRLLSEDVNVLITDNLIIFEMSIRFIDKSFF